MTLEQTFPGLGESPGRPLVALADNIFNFGGPGRELTTDLPLQYSKKLIDDIKAVGPNYTFQSLGVPVTFEGQMNQINGLRLDRAAAFYRSRGETRPLQVETLRFVQERTDRAYDDGVRLYKESSRPDFPNGRRSATTSIARCGGNCATCTRDLILRRPRTSR